jgi:hypothetical protein
MAIFFSLDNPHFLVLNQNLCYLSGLLLLGKLSPQRSLSLARSQRCLNLRKNRQPITWVQPTRMARSDSRSAGDPT